MLMMAIAAPMMAIGGVILALSQDAQLAWVLLAVMPVMAVIFAFIMRGAVPLSTAMQAKIDRLNLVLGEGLSGVRVIRALPPLLPASTRCSTSSRRLSTRPRRIDRRPRRAARSSFRT